MDTVSLTYDELATQLDITRKSAQNLSRRKGWSKSIGNDKRVRVQVPIDALPDTPPKVPSEELPLQEVSHEAAELRGKLVGAEAVIGFLKGQVEDLKQERDNWLGQARATQKILEDHSKQKSQGWLDKLLDRFQKTE